MAFNAPHLPGTTIQTADISSPAALIAAVANRTYSVKTLTISVTAACIITLESSAGTDLMQFTLPARGGVALEWTPDELAAAKGTGFSILSSTSDDVSVHSTFWFKDQS